MRTLNELLLDLDVAGPADVRVEWKLADRAGARTRPPPPGFAVAISPRVELLISMAEVALLVRSGARILCDPAAWTANDAPSEECVN